MFEHCKVSKIYLILGVVLGILLSISDFPFEDDICENVNIVSEGHTNLRDLKSAKQTLTENDEKAVEVSSQVTDKGKNKKDHTFIRPKFYLSELGIRNKVLVSVLSSMDSVNTFGIAINETLNQFVDKLIFFMDGLGNNKLTVNLPIVAFRNSKPAIFVYRILFYIAQNYLKDYDYFFIVNDHSYIHGIHLRHLLQHISVSHDIHMGELVEDAKFDHCSLDSGIILSRVLLQKVSERLSWCVENLHLTSVDENLGHCILHSTDMSCSSNIQDKSYSSYRINSENTFNENFLGTDENNDIQNAITVTGLKNQSYIPRLHLFYMRNQIRSSIKEIQKLQTKISPEYNDVWPLGSLASHVAKTRFDVINWETFNGTHIFVSNYFESIKPLSGVDSADIINVIKASVAYISQKNSTITYDRLNYGYRRYDPTRGMDYVLNLSFKAEQSNIPFTKLVKGYRGLTSPEFVPMPYTTEEKLLTLVLLLREEKVDECISFIDRLKNGGKLIGVSVAFVLINENNLKKEKLNNPFQKLKDAVDAFTRQYYSQNSRAIWFTLNIEDGTTPETIFFIDLIVRKFDGNDILLLMEPTAHFSVQFINRVRLNTIQNWQVFCPIPFALYHPTAIENADSYAKLEITGSNGHFDNYNYDFVSFYVSDYYKARKEISKNYPIIINENQLKGAKAQIAHSVSHCGLFLNSELHALRGVEPSLVLSYSEIFCSSNDEICLKRRSLSYGLRTQLSKIIVNYKKEMGS